MPTSPTPDARPEPAAERIYATGRTEAEPCEALTDGCAIDHAAEAAAALPTGTCETW